MNVENSKANVEISESGQWGAFGTYDAYLRFMVPRIGLDETVKALGNALGAKESDVRKRCERLRIIAPKRKPPRATRAAETGDNGDCGQLVEDADEDTAESVSEDHRPIRANGWTEDEDATLRKYYPQRGTNIPSLVERHGRAGVKRRASRIGVRYAPARESTGEKKTNSSKNTLWTKEDEEVLRREYPEHGTAIAEFEGKYSRNQIQRKAAKMGIHISENYRQKLQETASAAARVARAKWSKL